MRNLKKILALVLVLVMAMSFASAAYADADSINYTEAVDVMSFAGIFNGIDGEFQPQGDLTREQAMKIVAYMLLGQKKADALPKDIQPFDDVEAGRWSAGAIAYCANKGIVSGDGTGNFNPTANVTGYEFGKMVMGAAGIEGEFTGNGWKLNVALALEENGLLNNLDTVVLSENLTREEACQMAFNACDYGTVSYTGNYAIEMITEKAASVHGEVYASRSSAKAEMDVLGLVLNTDYKIVDHTAKQNSLLTTTHKVYNWANYTDDFGFEGNLWYAYKSGKFTVAHFTARDEHSSYENGAITAAELYASLGLTKYNKPVTAAVYTDGVYSEQVVKFNDKTVKFGGNGVSTTIYWDSYTSELKIVEVTNYIGTVVDVFEGKAETATTIALPATATIEYKWSDGKTYTETVETEAYEKDDRVMLTAAWVYDSTAEAFTAAIESHELANYVVGTVDKYVSGKSVTVNGTTYVPADSALALHPSTGIFTDYYVYYVDAYNNVYDCVKYVGGGVQPDGYYYVLGYQVSYTGSKGDLFNETADGSAAARALVLNLDGSVEVIELPVEYRKADDGFFFTKPNGSEAEIVDDTALLTDCNGWAAYKLVDGDVVFLGKAGEALNINKQVDVDTDEDGVVDYTLTSKTAYTYINYADSTVKTTYGYKKIVVNSADALVIADKYGVVSEIYVVNMASDLATSVANLAYAVENTGAQDAYGTAWTFVVDGTVDTKVVATAVTNVAEGGIYKLTIDSKTGIVTKAEEIVNKTDDATVVTVTMVDEDYFKGVDEAEKVHTLMLDKDYVVVDFATGAAAELAAKAVVECYDIDNDGDIDLIYDVTPVEE